MSMTVYLASPNTQQQAEHCAGMPVLLSFAIVEKCKWILKGYQQSFGRLLIDSGAYSELNSNKKVDVVAYADFMKLWGPHADAAAGLDDISGDWRRSLENYKYGGFPTFHDTDPPELLDDLIDLARERGNWIGFGVKPVRGSRKGKEKWLRQCCDRVPEDIHKHGWALREYTHIRQLNSVDSTNWWRDAMLLRTIRGLQHLTYGECLAIVVKRYQRWQRDIQEPSDSRQGKLAGFTEDDAA